MMKLPSNKILLICVVLFLIHTTKAQVVDSVFMNMPTKICPLLNKSIRFEMLEYFKVEQSDSVKNRLNGFSALTYRDTLKQTINFQVSQSSSYQLRVFGESSENYTIGIIHTISKPILSSSLKFYDANWLPVSQEFSKPTLMDCLHTEKFKNSKLDSLWLKELIKNKYLSLKFSEDSSNTLEVSNNSLEILSREDKESIEKLLTENCVSNTIEFYTIKYLSDKMVIERIKKKDERIIRF